MANIYLIRDLCKTRGISLKELSKKAQISEMGLQRILRTNSVKIDVLERISEALNVSPSVFFDNKYIPSSTPEFIEIVTGLDREFLITLSNRYDGYLDKISFLKDYYIWKIISFTMLSEPILRKGLPAFQFKYKDSPKFLVSPEQALTLQTFIQNEPKHYLPYSKMPSSRQGLIKTTNILLGFYFLLFRDNILNIRSLLTDGLISDPEIKKYWDKWKSIEWID